MRLVGVMVMLVACGDDGGAAMPDAAGTDAPSDAAPPSCSANTFPMTLTFKDTAFEGPSLADVHTCVITHPAISCVDSGIDGTVSFCAPTNSEIAISVEKTGYMPFIVSRVTTTNQPTDTRLRMLTLNPPQCTLWSSGGVACPPSATDAGGMLWIAARENMPGVDAGITSPPGYPAPLGDVAIELTPPAQVAPFYAVNGMKDPSLTATHPATGNAYAGGVAEGDQQIVKITRTGQTCHAFAVDAWPAGDGMIRVPIRKGFRTFAPVTCE